MKLAGSSGFSLMQSDFKDRLISALTLLRLLSLDVHVKKNLKKAIKVYWEVLE